MTGAATHDVPADVPVGVPEGVLLDAEVVVPLRWDHQDEAGHRRDVREMTDHLTRLAAVVPVTVVDGSRAERLQEHRDAWAGLARVLTPEPPPRGTGRNGKVAGAVTGVLAARHERVVIADDDVRHDAATLAAVVAPLTDVDVVRPQNVFTQWPWHARWDGGRSLLARAFAADWPGTFAVRRSTITRTGGWDSDVLFENLEMVRTVQAAGGRVLSAPHLVVPRLPPSADRFWSQRVRQAYDDRAQPVRLVLGLATVPVVVVLATTAPAALAALALAVVAVAEAGRRRPGTAGSGPTSVPATVPLWAPVWVLERGVCSWLALAAGARGGASYAGGRLRTAAHSVRWLRRELGAVRPSARIDEVDG